MPYQYFYDHVVNFPPSVGSRTHALIYPGAVCPQECNFGYVHGTSPAAGEVQFKGTVLIPIAQPMVIQIGQSVFYGFAVKGEINNHIQQGNNVKFQLVDMRDRLHDLHHAAQYNMVDDSGTWWHLFPDSWEVQLPIYIHDLEEVEDISTGQQVPTYDLNLLSTAPPPFSLMTIMQAFALWYDFTFSWTADAEEKLEKHYPENLDWNTPTRVIECIDQMLSRSNLQFTCWGDLHLHITDKGIPDNLFEEDLLSGNINLCALEGYTNASIGSELNTKGRRVVVLGGRNQHEWWFACYPDWNSFFTWNVVNPFSYDLSAILLENGLFADINLLEDMPEKFWDCRKYQGRSRMKMTIRDYVDKICFKAYRVDYRFLLRQKNIIEQQNINGRIITVETEPKTEQFQYFDFADSTFKDFRWFNRSWYGLENEPITDTEFPLSQKLVSDTGRQFLIKGTSRANYVKGERDDKAFFLNGVFTYLTDGVNIEIDEFIAPGPPDLSLAGRAKQQRRLKMRKEKTKCGQIPVINPEYSQNKKFYRTVLYFDQCKYLGHSQDGNELPPIIRASNPNQNHDMNSEVFTLEPDHIYVLLSIDIDIYYFILGEDQGTPRVREQVVNYSELKQFFKEGEEVPMLARNYIEYDYISIVFADELANEIAQRKLNHEFITTAGHIEFRTNAGFVPSGIIDSVNVKFDARRGTQEVINFTNIINDERIPSFMPAISSRNIKSEETLKREFLQQQAKDHVRRIRAQQKIGANKEDNRQNWGLLKVAQRFGGMDHAANVKIAVNELGAEQIPVGEIMVVDEATQNS